MLCILSFLFLLERRRALPLQTSRRFGRHDESFVDLGDGGAPGPRGGQRTRDGILADTVANPALDAIEAFTEYGNRLADRMQAQLDLDDVVPGCRFGNFAVELSTRDHEIRDHIAGIFDAMVEMTASMVRRSIDAGSLDPDTDAAAAARQLIAIMEGRMVLAKAAADPDLLRELGADAERLLH